MPEDGLSPHIHAQQQVALFLALVFITIKNSTSGVEVVESCSETHKPV